MAKITSRRFLPRSSRALRLCQLACVLSLAAPHSARAWKYHEHVEIGRESYRCACYWLSKETGFELPEAERCALASASLERSMQLETKLDEDAATLVEKLVCPSSSLEVAMERYGQATALAADHLEAPDDFESTSGLRDTVSFVTYALKAVQDGDHFHPRAPLMWQQYHVLALLGAERSHASLVKDGGAAQIGIQAHSELMRVLYENAFGDHFIQDSFAAGHMGMNRAATRPTAANNFHDRANFSGRIVRDRLGHIWSTHGDGKLHWPLSGKSEVLRASALSLYDTLRAFCQGHRSAVIGLRVAQLIPVEYCSGPACEDLERLARGSANQGADRPELRRRAGVEWIGLMLAHEPAHVTGAPGIEYRHALGEHGFLRNQLNVVTSFPLGTTFAFRLDVGFGVITPALRPSQATSLYFRAGLVVPIYASYGSAFTFDIALGLLDETCIDACAEAARREGAAERGIFGGYVGPRVNLELGRVALLQAFVEPFYAADYSSRAFWGLGFGVVLSKGTLVTQPQPFPGPLL